MKNVLAIITSFLALGWQASAISYDASINGLTPPSGVTFTPTGGSLQLKTVAGVVGLGVTGGASGGEIDIGQRLSVAFTDPQYIGAISLAFLYDGPEFGDNFEIAAIKVGGIEYKLQATSATTATWTGFGGNSAVINLNPAVDPGGAGAWEITNPFGNILVSAFDLYPLSSNPTGNESDFSLRGFQTRVPEAGFPVPDGGSSVALLGLAISGLLGFRRRNLS